MGVGLLSRRSTARRASTSASATSCDLPGIHFNFLLLIIGAIIICAIAGALIGLPTLRLRGDYIAIVTLAFGEIIGRVFANGDEITIFGDDKLSNGRQSISPIDQIDLPFFGEFDSAFNLRPYYWTVLRSCLVVLFVNFRLRDSRLGRAWIALREDEVAAASMGVPLVKTKLLSYAAGGAFGGISGASWAPSTPASTPTSSSSASRSSSSRWSSSAGSAASGGWCSAPSRSASSTTG